MDDVRKVQKLTVKERLCIKKDFWAPFLQCSNSFSSSVEQQFHLVGILMDAYNHPYLGEAD